MVTRLLYDSQAIAINCHNYRWNLQLKGKTRKVRSAEIVLGYTVIRAPIGGVVAGVATREGETIDAYINQGTLFSSLIDRCSTFEKISMSFCNPLTRR